MKMTKQSLLKVIGAVDDVISALAGTNDEVHKDETDKMVRLWDDLNDQYAPPEVVRELARMALAAMDSSESVELPLDYLQGHKDDLEWAAQLAESNHPETGDWLYDDPIELAKAIRKGPDMPPAQPVADSEPLAYIPVLYKGAELLSRSGLELIRDGASSATDLESACMAEALLASPQPALEYPETLPCPVLLEPGLRFGKGIKTSTMLAALARRAVYESDMAALSPEERAEFQAGIEDYKALIAQPASVMMDDKKLRELFDAWFASDCSFDQSPVASEADNIAWRESYWYVWQRCRGALLQELQKSAGTEELCRGNENAQVLHSIEVAPALSSLPKTGEVLYTNSSVNDVIAGKPLTIFLPDISSKAFWSGAGKNETFHPETYRRWAKEAIERGCIIACIDVEVK